MRRARDYRDPRDLAGIIAALGLDAPDSALRPIGLETVEIGADALERLVDVVQRITEPGPIALLMDAEPMRRGADDLKEMVADALGRRGPVVRVTLGQPQTELHADAAAINEAVAAGKGVRGVVAVGSGTICDIGKEMSRLLSVPYTVVQTANSVNAFSDDMAVLLVRGVKRTMPSRWPNALIVDLQVLADAPADLNQAGVGELAAMWTAPSDWRLAASAGADGSWDARVVALFRDGADALVEAAPMASADLASIEVMAELMTLSGLALGVAGRTAPISGTEHGISHLLDISAATDGRGTGLHGAQVGVGALVAAVIWDRVLSQVDARAWRAPELRDAAAAERAIAEAFLWLDATGEAAAECSAHYSAKLESWARNPAQRAATEAEWPYIAAELRQRLAPPHTIARLLASAGAPQTFDELDVAISRERAVWAVLNSPLQRERFSVADLAQAAGIWNQDFVSDAIDAAADIARSAAGQASRHSSL